MCLVDLQPVMEHTPVSSPTPVTSGVIVQQQSCAQVDDGSVSGISLLGGGPASSVGGSLSDSNLSSTTATIAAVGIPPGAIPVTPIHQKPKITSSAAGSTTATPVKGAAVGVVQPLTTAAATSCVPSPVLSPPRKIWGRNKNNTMVETATPSNEAELQLYRVLQRASLLSYFDTLLAMGGDDLEQFTSSSQEFMEIVDLVGMQSKPLHVRRLQKALQEWIANPSAFQTPLASMDTPCRYSYSPGPVPLVSNVTASYPPAAAAAATPYAPTSSFVGNPSSSTNLQPSPIGHQASGMSSVINSNVVSPIGSTTTNSLQLTPSLTEEQIAKITAKSFQLAQTIPQQLEPRQQNVKKRTTRDLEQVMAMNESDPRRMDEIRKYSAIYGRFDCKRRPEKPLTLHEVCVNEAAAQICKYVPALLTRRDELFPLARLVVKECGFGHSASIRLTGLCPSQPSRHDEMDPAQQMKRARLSSETSSDLGKENSDDNRDLSSTSLYQHMTGEKPFDLTDSSKFSFTRSEFDDADSRFSFSNSSSSPVQAGNGIDRDLNEHDFAENLRHSVRGPLIPHESALGVQVISSSGGHIIAVANPALALSPALSEAITIKREAMSPDL
ncbi:LOW QUALITY PROTEIN: NGFI-A-binding protein homolog [Culex quinquefasciatus]|uniref:LOW QUALITY PROTEIN: NGFI-A-binding protein homolog n=1 Tax=Culex quinquefasciatus TaxID=7176 RepID=UPI0018E2E00F|nr:LOW QUALITY PROTEIN: NGFI-A-binding protein homolog [Culex quinquefasciatus]